MEAAWVHMDCSSFARQTRAAQTLALVKALLMAHQKAPDRVFWPNLGGRVGGTQPGVTATQRQSRPRGRQPRKWCKNCEGVDHHCRGGDSGGGGGGVASGAGVTQGAAEGATLVQQTGQWPQLWRRQRRAEGWRERTFSDGRLVNLLPLVLSSSTDHSEVAVVVGKRCPELWQEERLALRLSPSCCVC